MPASGVTPELVALIPGGYTPLTWASAGGTSMQMAANTASGAAVVLGRLRFTRRVGAPRLQVAPMTESMRRYPGRLPAVTASRRNVLSAAPLRHQRGGASNIPSLALV